MSLITTIFRTNTNPFSSSSWIAEWLIRFPIWNFIFRFSSTGLGSKVGARLRECSSHSQTDRRSGKQVQGQNSPNLGPAFLPIPVLKIFHNLIDLKMNLFFLPTQYEFIWNWMLLGKKASGHWELRPWILHKYPKHEKHMCLRYLFPRRAPGIRSSELLPWMVLQKCPTHEKQNCLRNLSFLGIGPHSLEELVFWCSYECMFKTSKSL